MKKLKSFSEIKTFNNYEISKQIKSKVMGGLSQLTAEYFVFTEQTCDYSCQDSVTNYYNDGVLYQTHITENNINCQ